MKLTNNEKKVLKEVIKDPRVANKELSTELNITVQGVGKIKKSLYKKGIISDYEAILDYEKMEITCFAFTLVKIMPRAFRKHKKDLKDILSHPNIITLVNIAQTNITNIILFGFRDVSEYSNFFRLLQTRLPGIIEIKESYVFSNDSFIKNSASDLFIKVLEEFGEKRVSKPKPPKIEEK